MATALGRELRCFNQQRGFTLIELLLALSILSVILVIVFGALQITVRAWEKGESMVAVQQRSRTVLDQLDRQLSSAVVLLPDQEDQPLVPFAGTERSIEFTSGMPLMSELHHAPVHVKYLIEPAPDGKMRLLVHEKAMTIEDFLSGGALPHDRDGYVLTEDPDQLRFEYLGDADDPSDLVWASTWQQTPSMPLPRAVRITSRGEQDSAPVRVIARLDLWRKFRQEVQ